MRDNYANLRKTCRAMHEGLKLANTLFSKGKLRVAGAALKMTASWFLRKQINYPCVVFECIRAACHGAFCDYWYQASILKFSVETPRYTVTHRPSPQRDH